MINVERQLYALLDLYFAVKLTLNCDNKCLLGYFQYCSVKIQLKPGIPITKLHLLVHTDAISRSISNPILNNNQDGQFVIFPFGLISKITEWRGSRVFSLSLNKVFANAGSMTIIS